MSVQEQLTFSNPAAGSLAEIDLVVEPNLYYKGFSLNSIGVDGQDYSNAYNLKGHLLSLELTQPLAPGASTVIALNFEENLPQIPPPSNDQKPQVYGYTDRQTNLADWLIYLPPLDANGDWVVHEPSYFGEYLVFPVADFDVQLQIVNAAQALVVTGSSPAEQDGDQYHFTLKDARNFVVSMSPDYQELTANAGDTTINVYIFPLDQNGGKQVLDDAVRAYTLYEQTYGPLNRKSLNVVEADFLDGMEYQGLIFLSKGFFNLYDGTEKGYLSAITVHETAHQWWYAAVANDQAMQPWLDEALATYSEEVYYEKAFPDLASWWWGYRVDYYDPSGYIDLSVYDYKGYEAYRNAVYLNGAKFLQQVRDTMGDDLFFASLSEYHQEFNKKIANENDLIGILQKNSPEDLSVVFSSFLKNP